MGVVHLARRPGERRVALKVLRPTVIGDDESRARLAQEVSSLRRIRSMRVAEIVDADPWGDIPYVATRYVPGWSLHQVVTEEGPLAADDVEHFAGQLIEALAVVHAVGVVHRDVKPSNVLLEGRNPVLIDFGLARVADDPRLTQSGSTLGTPGYLAPEILHGEEATSASDVHAWASTVAFAATGRAAFGSGPQMAVMDRVRRGVHDLTGVPEPLASLLEQALSLDPAERPTVRELRAWFSGEAPMTAVHRITAPGTAPLLEPPPTAPMWIQQPPMRRVDALAVAPEHREPAGEAAGTPGPGTAVLPDGGATVVTEADGFGHSGFTPPGFPAGLPSEFSAEPQRPDLASRLQNGAVTVGLVLVLSGLFALAPVFVFLATGLAVWLVRAGSIGASSLRSRRDNRGVKWYDTAQTVAASPWTLLSSLPRASLLVLWAAGMGGAILLFCYAFSPPPSTSLVLAGLVFFGALWLGPGTDRWAPPLVRATARLRESPVNAGVTLVVCVLLAAVFLALAQAQVRWWPLAEAPFAFLS